MIKRAHHFLQFVGNGILTVKLRLVEDGHKNVFGQHVLDDHLARIGQFHARIDGLLAQYQKLTQGCFERRWPRPVRR